MGQAKDRKAKYPTLYGAGKKNLGRAAMLRDLNAEVELHEEGCRCQMCIGKEGTTEPPRRIKMARASWAGAGKPANIGALERRIQGRNAGAR